MKLQQKHKPPNNLTLKQKQIGLSSDLRRLVDLWLSNTVDQFYQTKVMAYIDQFQNKQIQLKQIKKQIELTLKKQSIFFMIRHLLQEKDHLVDSLNKQMQSLQKYCDLDNEEDPDLGPVSNILSDLRQTQMLIVQAIMQFLSKYKIKNYRSNYTQTEKEHSSILAYISTDINFLKNSVLKYYIPFAEELDPLFVEQSRRLKKNYKENTIVNNKNIQKFLNLTPSFMYRLLRAKKNIDKLMVMQSEKQNNYHYNQKREQIDGSKDTIEQKSQPDPYQSGSMNQQTIEAESLLVNQPRSQKILQSKKVVLSFKLDNSAYMIDHNKLKSRANTRNETIEIFQQKYKRNNALPQGIVQHSRNRSGQNQNRMESEKKKSKSKTLKLEEKQVQIYLGEPKHIPSLKFNPTVLKIDIKSQIKNRKQSSTAKRSTFSPQFQQNNINLVQSRKVRDEGMQYNPIEILSKNKRFYLLQLQKDSSINQQNSQLIITNKKHYQRISDDKSGPRRLQSIDSINFRNKIKPRQHCMLKSNKLNYSGNYYDKINQKQLRQFQYRQTHKNFSNFSQNNSHRHKNQQKYPQNDNKIYYNRQLNEEQEHFIERQKQMITKINKKYRQLAMKQKEYQLSKLGHNIYHRMKEKLVNKQTTSPTRKYNKKSNNSP